MNHVTVNILVLSKCWLAAIGKEIIAVIGLHVLVNKK